MQEKVLDRRSLGGFTGRAHTKESIEKIRAAKLGKSMSDETKAKIRAHKIGKKHSPETKLAMSRSRKGRPITEETKIKIGLANKGRKLRPEHIEKLRQCNTGRTPWNKVGDGITPGQKVLRIEFRNKLQRQVFERDDYTCQICDQRGGYLQADHIKSWADFPELRFDLDNCRTLCMGCHYYVTFKRKLPQGTIWGHNLSRRIAS
jgi:5-methylcytosine-specific restriction endonuclease McrA